MGKFLVSNGTAGGGWNRNFALLDSSIQKIAEPNEIRQGHNYSCSYNETIVNSILIEQGTGVWSGMSKGQSGELSTRPSEIKSAIAKCLWDIIRVYCWRLRLIRPC
jgi:hypothetical protein